VTPPLRGAGPRPDLVVHIGSGKTGTTSIQRLLADNREVLARHGVLYPRSPGNERHGRFGLHLVANERMPDEPLWRRVEGDVTPAEFRARLVGDLRDEVAAHGLPRLLLSDEALYGAPDDVLERLRSFATAHADRLTLLCYLRRQDDHVASRYQQVVKVGEVRRMVERVASMDLSSTYDYDRRLATWERIVEPDRFVVRRFEPAGFVDGSLAADFLAAADIDAPLDAFSRVRRQNESLDAESVEFLRILNLHRVHEQGATVGQVNNRRLVRRLADALSGPTLTLPREQLEAFMTHWEPGNQRVRERYFADEDGPLFHTPRRTAGTTSVQRLEPDRLDHLLEVTQLPPRLHAPMRRLVEQEAR